MRELYKLSVQFSALDTCMGKWLRLYTEIYPHVTPHMSHVTPHMKRYMDTVHGTSSAYGHTVTGYDGISSRKIGVNAHPCLASKSV